MTKIQSVKRTQFASSLEVTDDKGLVSFIPVDKNRHHYQEVLEWEKNGGVIAPADPAPIPTAKQKRRADPQFPDFQSFMEAVLDSKPAKLNAMKTKFVQIKARNV